MKIYRDKNGVCINIGDWDYQIDETEKQHNPLPVDATEDEAEVVTGWDGGLYLADDPRRLG
jgi:hypothetical protein